MMAHSKETERNCLDEEIVIDQYGDVLGSWECRCPRCFRLSLEYAYLGPELDEVESEALFLSTFCLNRI